MSEFPPLKENKKLTTHQIPLRVERLADTQVFPREILLDFSEGNDNHFIRNMVVANFRTYVYASDPHQTVDEFAYEVVLKPWWIPRFIWNRLRREEIRRTKVYTARMLYPDLDLPIPEKFGVAVYKFDADENVSVRER